MRPKQNAAVSPEISVDESLTPKLARMNVKGPFAHAPWYFGPLSRDQADSLLNGFGIDGDFLVRDSESNPGDFSVSLKAPGRNKHFWVRIENGGSGSGSGSGSGIFYGIGNRQFPSLEILIAHYKQSPIYTNDRGDRLFLIKPLPANQ